MSLSPEMIGSLAGAAYYLDKHKKEQPDTPPISKQNPKYHSFLLWLFFGWVVFWIPCIYYFFSDKHQFKFL